MGLGPAFRLPGIHVDKLPGMCPYATDSVETLPRIDYRLLYGLFSSGYRIRIYPDIWCSYFLLPSISTSLPNSC